MHDRPFRRPGHEAPATPAARPPAPGPAHGSPTAGTPRRSVRWLACAVVAGTLTGALLLAQSPAPQSGWTPVTEERLRAPADGDWMSYRRTDDVMGFSPLRQITRENVAQLRPVWAYSMRDNSRWLPTPIVANGLMYVAEGSGRVVAFDAVSGELVWTHLRRFPEDISRSEAYPRHRGLAIYRDMVYWGTADSYLVALDARTGKPVWEVQTGDYTTGEGHAHPPIIAEGKVFIGNAGGDFGARGKVQAFDAETGRHLWTFNAAPLPGEPGSDTWGDVEPLGAAPWNTLSYDPELRLVYASTGQPTPWTEASRGPGDALYSNAVLALEAETGRLRWHYQLVPGDSWDRAAYENMLVDLEIGGVMRKALIQTGKIGWGVVLDRVTGTFLHAFRTAYDNVVTGWTPEGRPIYNPDSITRAEHIDSGHPFEICPHLHGARNLQAPSYSPLTGLYYLGVNNSCMTALVTQNVFLPGRGYNAFTFSASLAPGHDYVGEFVAFDPVRGTRAWAWRPPSGAPMTASALATAGGVVFGGTADRQFFALDTDTGELLWQMRLNGDISGAPITFEVDGKQYVAVGAGGRAAPTTTLGRLVRVDVPQGSGVMWVFALPDVLRDDVRSGVIAPAGPAAAVTSALGAGVAAAARRSVSEGVYTRAQAQRGQQVFEQACAMCHLIEDHIGTSFDVKWSNHTLGDIYEQIALTMPPASPGSLPPDGYASVLAYFLSRSGYPQGSTDLPADRDVLRGIRARAP
jgi:alcohol dehydrogenase (cytochrome c)